MKPEHIVHVIKKDPPKHFEYVNQLTDDEVFALVLYNQRSLRLTYTGFVILSKMFKHFEIKTPHDYISNKHILYLTRHLKSPFFIDRGNNVCLFDQEDAFVMSLVSGDIDKLVEIF